MEGIPVLGLSAYSGTGKTTLMEKLIAALTARGLRVGAVKHDGHDFEIDHPGKDSWRYTQAGAAVTAITSLRKTAFIKQAGASLEQVLAQIGEVDIILVEGWKNSGISRIGLCRRAVEKDFPSPVEDYVALVTDREDMTDAVPRFGFDEIEELTEFIMENKKDFTHFDAAGRAKMVDVGEKPPTVRTAVAAARVLVNGETFRLIQTGGVKKGDVLTVAQIAGIMGAKRTPELIPMCHPILVDGVELSLELDEARSSVEIRATVRCGGRTGVEMEALTAASVAALTVYDMCKAVQRDMVITDVRLMEKTGGVHGDYHREGEAI